MLLLQIGVLPFEQLQLRDLAGRAGWRRLRGSSAEPTIARILPPLGQHEGMDLQRRGDRLHLHPWLLT